MKPTHEYHPYKAYCIQWNKDNTAEVLALLRSNNDDALMYGEYIMVRFRQKREGRKDIETIDIGWWVAKGENGDVKCYNNEQFHIKYRETT